MKPFTSPAKWIADIDADAAAALIAAAADLAIVLDRKGIVRDVAFQTEALAEEFAEADHWIGRPWAESVTVESRPKVAEMLQAAAQVRRGNGRAKQGDAPEAEPCRPAADMPGNGRFVPAIRSRQINYPGARGNDVPMMVSVVPVGGSGRAIAFGRYLRSVAVLQQRLLDVQQSLERDFVKLRQVETRYRILFQMSS